MKTRIGFVSNSSSCSFLIVGIDNQELATEMAKADRCTEMGWGGYSSGETLVYLGGEGGYDDEPYKPYYAGIEIEHELENKTIADLRKEFIAKAEDIGFTIPAEQVRLHYGEVSSE